MAVVAVVAAGRRGRGEWQGLWWGVGRGAQCISIEGGGRPLNAHGVGSKGGH